MKKPPKNDVKWRTLKTNKAGDLRELKYGSKEYLNTLEDSFSMLFKSHLQTPVITKIAPIKYTEDHFKEVDELRKTLKAKNSIEQVALKYKFSSVEGFKQQYYSVWYNKKVKRSLLK